MGQTATVTVSQPQFMGPFTASVTGEAGVATIAPSGVVGQFTITATGVGADGSGTTTVAITGGGGQHVTYTVQVAVTTITPS